MRRRALKKIRHGYVESRGVFKDLEGVQTVAPFFVTVHLLVDDTDLAAQLCKRHAELHAPLPDLTADMEVDRMGVCADDHRRIIG